MLTRLFRFAAPAVVVAALIGPASAQKEVAPNGKKAVLKLFTDAVSKVADSTVQIRMDGKVVSLGTVVDAKGYILTKGDELKSPISVRLRGGEELDAEYIGYDQSSDLAMLKVDAELPPVTFAGVSKIVVGNWVAAAGFDSDPVAAGVISAGPRQLFGPEAAISNGNRGYLGVNLSPKKDIDGVEVLSVLPESGSAKAEIKKDDIITSVNGTKVKSFEQLQAVLQSSRPGDKVVLLITRGETELEKTVKLGSSANFDRGEMQNKMGSDLSNRRTGFPKVIMHDSVIKPQHCGSALVDLDGNVLGINIARAGRVESWALPPDVILEAIPKLKSGKLAPPTKK